MTIYIYIVKIYLPWCGVYWDRDRWKEEEQGVTENPIARESNCKTKNSVNKSTSERNDCIYIRYIYKYILIFFFIKKKRRENEFDCIGNNSIIYN